VPTSASLSFDKMEGSLQNAADMFLLPLLGTAMMAALDDIYDDENATETETQLLTICQLAEANLAMWYNFDALQLRITDQGFQRQGSDDWQQAYKYQEDRLRDGFKVKGFNALDQLLEFLEEHIEDFTDYEESPAHVARGAAIVKNTAEVDNWVYINHSRLIYLRMANEFPTVEETVLRPAMGDSLFEAFLGWLEDGGYPETYSVTLEQLRKKCARVVVTAAAVRLIQLTGSLTERGLYFQAVAASGSDNNSRTPADDARIGDRLKFYNDDKELAIAALRRFVNTYYSDLADGKSGQIIRDNDDHAAFFAM